MFLVYQQVKKCHAEKSRRAAQSNGQEAPSEATPQPQYAPNEHGYPPSDTTTQDQLGPPPPCPTQSEQNSLDGVKERNLAQLIKTYLILAANDFIYSTPGAWLVPIAALILLRFPPAEATNMNYVTLARVVREGGLLITIIMRYSALPGHFTTAVFATCGMTKIQNIVLAITVVITVLAMGYIRILREKAKPAVVWDRRMARQTKLQELSG
ncbi:hypothetical protein B0H11DRAFT_2035168 [Mycena galericulata]|nr:hypothetical protein B0H11DRAFT_2035168 [Mycena galericulata]